MKGLIFFCLLLTLVTAIPLKGKLKIYSRKQNLRQDIAAPPSAPKVAPIVGEVSSGSGVDEIGSSLIRPSSAPNHSAMPTMVPAGVQSARSIVGNVPFGESLPSHLPPLNVSNNPSVTDLDLLMTTEPQVSISTVSIHSPDLNTNQTQPQVANTHLPSSTGDPGTLVPAPVPAVIQTTVSTVAEPSVPAPTEQAATQPVPDHPPAPPLAPGTEPVVAPTPVVEVSTKKPESEEDDSSSEEEEAEARQLLSPAAGRRSSGLLPKQDIVVNAYVSSTGQVLVPLDVYQKYFHNSQPLSAENEQTSSSASSEEEDETDGSSENLQEKVPIRVSSTSVIYKEKVKNETDGNIPNLEEEEDDSEKPSSSSPEEPEDKPSSAESGEKPLEQDGVQPVNSFNPPPLAAIPATRPTGEDDEEEAGRYGFPNYEHFPENQFLSANNDYYRYGLDEYEY